MDFSFSGCGFLGIYHVGVASCLKQYAPHLLINNKLCGASAGGMIAACLMCGCDLGQITSYSLRIASKARSRSLGPLHPSFNIHKILRDGLEEILPNNAHEICSGNLFISLTRVHDRKNVQVSQFDTRDDLISALLCSSFIPFYSGMIPPAYKGVRYVDGGLSDNSPVIDDNTVTVTPFAGESDICPMDKNNHIFQVYLANTSMQLTFHNLSRFSNIFFPPHPDILSNMCQQGFDDTLKFLQRNDLISCKRCFKIRTSIVPAPLAPTPPINHDENSDDSDFHSESEDENCEECQKQKQQELIDSLPQQVLSAFEAIKSKGVLMKIADSRVYTVASLMVQPWVLPVEVVYLLGKRFLTWVPYLPMDTHWAVSEAFELLKMVVRYINRGRHRYSARFAYQLAVTDLTFNEEELLPSSHEEIYSARASTMRRIEMEMDLAKDAESRHDSAMRCLEEIRHQIIEAEDSEPQHIHHHHHHHHDDHHHHKRPSKDFRMSLETTEGHEGDNYDTFDDCLRIADEMDAIWSYYYTDENNPNIVKVMEVYGVPDSEDGENVSASLDTGSAENVPALELFH